MEKIVLLYDKSMNQIKDEQGNYIGCPSTAPIVYLKNKPSVDEVSKLVSAGMTADDIIKLKNSEVI